MISITEGQGKIINTFHKGGEITELYKEMSFNKTGVEIKQRMSALIASYNTHKDNLHRQMCQLIEQIDTNPNMPFIPYKELSVEQKALTRSIFCYSDEYCYPPIDSMNLSPYHSADSSEEDVAKLCRRYNAICEQYCDNICSQHELQCLHNNILEDKVYTLSGKTLTELGF